MDLDEAEGAGQATRIARTAFGLAVAGFVPFAALTLWLIGIAEDHPSRGETILLLKVYSAVTLSFLGGVRWGMEIHRHGDARRRVLYAGMIGPLTGWLAFLAPTPYTFAVLAAAFAGHGAWDSIASHSHAVPRWYGRMRTVLTALVVATMIVAFMATDQSGNSFLADIG